MDFKEIKLKCGTRSWHIYAHKYHIKSTGSIFWPCDEKKETETSLRTGLILKEKAAGERSERRCSMDGKSG